MRLQRLDDRQRRAKVLLRDERIEAGIEREKFDADQRRGGPPRQQEKRDDRGGSGEIHRPHQRRMRSVRVQRQNDERHRRDREQSSGDVERFCRHDNGEEDRHATELVVRDE